MQEENAGLKLELEKERKRADEAEIENKELKQRLSRLEKDKKEMMGSIRQ